MEKIRFVLFEDNAQIAHIITEIYAIAGYELAGHARDIDEASDLVDQLAGLGVIFALVDGNLEKGKTDGYDGAVIALAIRQEDPNVVIIGISSGGRVDNAHYNVDKLDVAGFKFARSKLPEILKKYRQS